MKNQNSLSDAEFLDLFIHCKLNPTEFSHEAHLRIAWVNIEQFGIKKAIVNIQKQLLNFVKHAGAKDKYNKTLTIAAAKTVYHFMLKSKSNNFNDFILEFPRLKYHFKELLSSHYSFDIYNLESAKIEFLQPDLVPFD